MLTQKQIHTEFSEDNIGARDRNFVRYLYRKAMIFKGENFGEILKKDFLYFIKKHDLNKFSQEIRDQALLWRSQV